MTFEVETPGRTRVVEIAGVRGAYEVVVDGRRLAIDAAAVGQAWSLLAAAGPAGASAVSRSYDVVVGGGDAGSFGVIVNGRAVPVDLRTGHSSRGRRRQGRRTGSAEADSGPVRVAAPMPGRVVKVLVGVGDAVAARQGVVVVEAMKMENELRSPRAGTVTEVRVVQGALVEANAVLIVVG